MLLRESSGRWISGQAIADELGISRNAVSKHVKLMRDNGVKILASTNRGYRFMDAEDKIYPYEIILDDKRQLIGGKIHLYKKLDSTNAEVERLVLKNKIKEGALIIAENQSKGKAYDETDWLTIKGKGLYFSIYLNPRNIFDKLSILTIIAGYSYIEAVKRISGLEDFQLTWPNAITYQGKKFTGILAESFTDLDGVGKIVLGIGSYINLTPKEQEFIAENDLTSLNAISKKNFNRNELVAHFLNIFNVEYLKFKSKELTPNLERWAQYLNILNKNYKLEIEGTTHKGTITGITENGKLIFVADDDNKKEFHVRYTEFNPL